MSTSILIVDDQPANLLLLRYILDEAGYTTHAAATGAEALALATSLRPRMMLLDLGLPDIDGLTVTRRLRADTGARALIIVAVTAQAMAGDRETAIAAGCDGFITKPIDTRTFLATVEAFLTRGGGFEAPEGRVP